jgi:hypothetical protein
MVRRQGSTSRRAGVLPHGRLLRAVLRRCGSRGRRARHRTDPARRAQWHADPDVRRAAARGGGVSRPSDPSRLPGRGDRADGGSQVTYRQGPAPPRRGASRHSRNDHRRGVAGSWPGEPAARAGTGPRWHRRGLARCVHRTVRDRRPGAGRPVQPARPVGASRDPGAGRAAARRVGRQARSRRSAVAASGGTTAARGGVRRRQRGRVRQLHRCRGDRRPDGSGLRARHPGRHAAAAGSPRTAGTHGTAGDGRGDAVQPGDPSGT